MIWEKKVKREWIAQAEKEAAAMGKLKGSITGGEGNSYAFIGEIVSCLALHGKRNNTYQHDFLLPNGKRVEVKTMRTSVKSVSRFEPDFNCKVCAANTTQDCDYYLFTRVTYDYSTCYLVGYLPREEFWKLAVPAEKGEYDPHHNVHGYFEKHACFNLPIKHLRDIKELFI